MADLANENTIRIFLIIVALAQTAICIPYLKRSKAGRTIFQRRAEGHLLSAAIVLFYLAYLAAFVIYVIHPPWMSWSAFTVPPAIRVAGAIPLVAGGIWMIWGLHELGMNLTISVSTRREHHLVTSGPYGWVRHPLYAGGMIQSVGIILLMANWFIALSAGLFWALIIYRTPIEESILTEKFGDDYRLYVRRVGRFLPRLK